jgi:glycosyltransferase involved in cell wall biosynthesis
MKATGVTLLVTHFNRSKSLERLLAAFRSLDCAFDDIVVSDDASKPEHLDRLKVLAEEHPFRLVTTPVNRGLGNNLNKGQDAVTTPYTLYVQEDFHPTPRFTTSFPDAFEIMEARRDVDMVRLYAGVKYPRLKPYKNGFSEMIFSLACPGPAKFFYYSDTPHLRRRSFFERFGRYAEGVKAIQGEKSMVMSFLQARGKGMECDVNDIFVHENSETEPSTQDYSAFFRIKRRIPEPVFEAIWTAKLTAQFLFVRYRRDERRS